MVIFDTCILIDICRGNEQTKEKIISLNSKQFYISAVTEFEFLAGARNRTELSLITKHLSNYTILPLNSVISDLFVELARSYSLSHKLSVPDILIATTSIHYNIPILTNNHKDFKFIPEINLIA
jgi:tRNA(fMet)-specific endonuclease VapC